MEKRVLFVRSQTDEINGQSILDDRLISILKKSFWVDVVWVRHVSRGFGLPLWNRSRAIIDMTRDDLQRYDRILVSHESNFNMFIDSTKCILIWHNVYSNFTSPWLIANSYYRLGSLKWEKTKMLEAYQNVFISKRDIKSVTRVIGRNNCCEIFVGYDLELTTNRESYNGIFIENSKGWFVKRWSALSRREEKIIGKHFEFTNYNEARYVLIVDRFLAGYKLKLSKYLAEGKIVMTLVDLSEEINGKYNEKNVYYLRRINSKSLASIIGRSRQNTGYKKRAVDWDISELIKSI